MKLQFASSPIITSENMDSSVMGMDESGMDQACFFLRDKIYSDKVLAVVREYSCNALDEHVKYNIKRAVEIGIRNDNSANFFFVRDFARGLSEYDIRNVFGKYFKSTKRNNNIQSGSFGLGAKAAHCYTDSFYVKSFHEGVCSLYVCALGGGNTGVPVGHILKVSECATDETGLEVYLEIKTSDRENFIKKCRDFTRFCSDKIIFHKFDELIYPEIPFAQVEENGFVFKFFKNKDHSLYNVRYSMGNVIYKEEFVQRFHNHHGYLNACILVIDIPIGQLTLPISREKFEETPSNIKILKNISDTIADIAQKDIDSLAPMSIEELLQDRDYPSRHGKYFSIDKKNLYRDIYTFVNTVSTIGSVANYEKFKNKPICAIVKSEKSQIYWRGKLQALATKNNKKYYFILAEHLKNCNADKLSDSFELRNIKSTIFNWPKSSNEKIDFSMDAQFSVIVKEFNSQYYKTKRFSALEVYNYIGSQYIADFEPADTVEEAREEIADLSFTSLGMLKAFSLENVNDSCKQGHTLTRSVTLYKNLISLGFFNTNSQEYKNQSKALQEIENKKREISSAIQRVQKRFLTAELKTVFAKKAEKNIKFAQKTSFLFEKLEQEHSIRGKVIRSFANCSYWNDETKLTRKDLRTILRLK